MRSPRGAILAGVLAALLPTPLPAQTQAPPAEPAAPAEKCQAQPAPAEGQNGQGQNGQELAPAAPDDLTAKLDECNGVLQPPPTGDGEIREPAPEGGETPVIPPGALPEQPPPADGSAPASGNSAT